ncbi:MAG: hypothetical protein ACI8S6_001782 [Myxococcota bacterium]|jgi:hypothetical protein
MDAQRFPYIQRLSEKLALLLTADGAEVQDQGWELLRCLPEISLCEVQQAMTGMLLAQLRLQGRTRVLGGPECEAFTRRFFALRRFCDLFDLSWVGARLQVDRWPAAPARRGRIRLLAGSYDIGRSYDDDDVIGDYAIISIPEEHLLRTRPSMAGHLGGLFHDRFLLSSAGTLSLASQHPASQGRPGRLAL